MIYSWFISTRFANTKYQDKPFRCPRPQEQTGQSCLVQTCFSCFRHFEAVISQCRLYHRKFGRKHWRPCPLHAHHLSSLTPGMMWLKTNTKFSYNKCSNALYLSWHALSTSVRIRDWSINNWPLNQYQHASRAALLQRRTSQVEKTLSTSIYGTCF